MITGVSLVDGAREMLLLPRAGVSVQKLEAPFPAVREVVDERTDDDGELDDTLLFGARAVTVELLVTDAPGSVEAEIGRFLHPRTRPYLVVADSEWSQERRLRLRVAQFEHPRTVDLPRMRRIQAQWRCPDGIWEAADLTQVDDINADLETSDGLDWPITFPVSFVATTATGTALVTNLGAVPSHFVVRLYGPCTAPRLINETTGEEIAFTSSLSLGAGEYVEVSTRDRTAYLLSNTALSQLNHVDFEVTSWWRIEPGEQQVRYAPASASAGSVAVIEYRPAWLT